MKDILRGVFFFFLLLSFSCIVFADREKSSPKDSNIQKYQAIAKAIDYPGRRSRQYKKAEMLKDARSLAGQGHFEEAIQKCQNIFDLGLIDVNFDAEMPLAFMMEFEVMQGQYEKALAYNEKLMKITPVWEDEKNKIESLIESKKTNSPMAIFKFIKKIYKKNHFDMPPNRISSHSEVVFSEIIKLYDIIGDFDAGIALCDDFAKHATQTPRIQNQYLAIRKAFEEDKKEGRESYITKSGKLGRATRALMKSNYFTW